MFAFRHYVIVSYSLMERSQPACPLLTATSLLIVINTLDSNLNTYDMLLIYSSLHLGKALRDPLFFHPFCRQCTDKITYHKAPLQQPIYQIWECIKERRQGGARWFSCGMSLRGSAVARVDTFGLNSVNCLNDSAVYMDFFHRLNKKQRKKNLHHAS